MWVFRCGMSTIRISWWVCMSMTATRPANSQLNTAILPSGVKSPWSMPVQSGYCTRSTSCQVTGSYQIRLRSASATEIAYLPSGVKYMLYGSATGIVSPGLPGDRVDPADHVADIVGRVQRGHVVATARRAAPPCRPGTC